jgi:putative glutamine amidotransferase
MAEPRPRIGVTRWEDVLGERIEDYWERIQEAGGEPVDVHGPRADAPALDGLVLTGGYDVAPDRYGATPHPKVKYTDPARDEFEAALLADALARDVPVLAICRGHQFLNVALGGSLLQHIENGSHRADYRREGYPSSWHTVRLRQGSRLREVLDADEVEVNSRHHQAVLPETLAAGLLAAASTPDGVIEGAESTAHRWVVGVQWHAERPEAEHPKFVEDSRKLFEAFVKQARTLGERT